MITVTVKVGKHPDIKFPMKGVGNLFKRVLKEAGEDGNFQVNLGKKITGTSHMPRFSVKYAKNSFVLCVVKPGNNGTCHEARIIVPAKYRGNIKEFATKLRDAARRLGLC